ncbi:MAG: response regulator [Planctomycetota bacterium]|jgi:CheY-like chemotaxis protein
MAKRILIVDDDADFREATELVLAGAGYEVSEAADAKEAEEKLRSEKIDLILLDIIMDTDTEGFHLAYKLRKDEKLKDIPIVILTCIEEKTGEEIEFSKSGDYLPVDAFLRKPLNADELKAQIAELLK